MASRELEEDPFNEELLLSAICSLRNVPIPSKRPYKKRKKPEPKPKVYVTLDPRFLISAPEHYKPLPEGDKRWKIPEQLAQCYVTGDRERYRQVMGEMCIPEIEFFSQYDGKQNPYGPNFRYIQGLSNLLDFGTAWLNSAPDLVMMIYEPPTVLYDEETDCCFGSYKCLASFSKISVVVHPEQLSGSSSSDASFNVEGDVLNSINDYNLVRLPPTMPVVTSYQATRYTFTLNADHKITKLCLLFKHIPPPSEDKASTSQSRSKSRKTNGSKKRKLSSKVVTNDNTNSSDAISSEN